MLADAENDILPSDVINDGQGTRSFVIPYYTDEDGDGNKKMRSFEIELPKAQGRRCWGSPYGWLVTVGLDLNIGLLNPFTGERLPLTSYKILQHQSLKSFGISFTPRLEPDATISIFIRKFALGWYESSQSWLVMTIFGAGQEVAFTSTGIDNGAYSSSSTWTVITYAFEAKDVILFQGRIFIIGFGGALRVCDIEEGTPPEAVHISLPPDQLGNSDTFYLVEIDGNLHFVARYYDAFVRRAEIGCGTSNFRVWRFGFSNTMWYELDDLGENALFLGNNSSYAISTITYPDFSKNCIYFTDDRYAKYKGSCDMGVYDYKEKTVKPFDIANMGAVSKFSRPTFFMPTF